MRLNKREKIILIAALFIAIVVLFINFVYFPINEEIKDLQVQSLELSTQVSQAQAKFASIQSLKTQKEQLEKDIDAKNDGIISGWDQPTILYFIEDSISRYAKILSVDMFDPYSIAGITSGEVTYMINVDYNDLTTIWGILENAECYTTVQSFAIEKAANTGVNEKESQKELNAEIILRFYAQSTTDEPMAEESYKFMNGQYGRRNIYK